MPDLPKTAAEYDRQVAARAVCFTAVLATGRKREHYEFKCDTAAGRYNQFLAAVSQAKGLRDPYGRRGMVYAVDAAGRDVHLAEALWPEVMAALRHAAQHCDAHQPQQQEKQMVKAKTRRAKSASKPTKKTAAKPAAAMAQPTGHAQRALKTTGVIYAIKKHILEDPGMSAADLTAKLVADGFTPSPATIASFRTDFVHSLRVLKSCGYDIRGV